VDASLSALITTGTGTLWEYSTCVVCILVADAHIANVWLFAPRTPQR
jgi:hypothetical protein